MSGRFVLQDVYGYACSKLSALLARSRKKTPARRKRNHEPGERQCYSHAFASTVCCGLEKYHAEHGKKADGNATSFCFSEALAKLVAHPCLFETSSLENHFWWFCSIFAFASIPGLWRNIFFRKEKRLEKNFGRQRSSSIDVSTSVGEAWEKAIRLRRQDNYYSTESVEDNTEPIISICFVWRFASSPHLFVSRQPCSLTTSLFEVILFWRVLSFFRFDDVQLVGSFNHAANRIDLSALAKLFLFSLLGIWVWPTHLCVCRVLFGRKTWIWISDFFFRSFLVDGVQNRVMSESAAGSRSCSRCWEPLQSYRAKQSSSHAEWYFLELTKSGLAALAKEGQGKTALSAGFRSKCRCCPRAKTKSSWLFCETCLNSLTGELSVVFCCRFVVLFAGTFHVVCRRWKASVCCGPLSLRTRSFIPADFRMPVSSVQRKWEERLPAGTSGRWAECEVRNILMDPYLAGLLCFFIFACHYPYTVSAQCVYFDLWACIIKTLNVISFRIVG